MPTMALVAAGDPNLELILKVLPALVVILLTAGVCGRLALMVMQPRVLGEMVAGVLLGPTLFGWLFPEAQAALFPKEVRPVLYVLSTIGLTLYMFLVGAGLDHSARSPGEIRRGSLLAVSGILPSLLLGSCTGLLLWDVLSRPDVSRWEFALFVGGALSLTAFPMLARILYERKLENSPLGRLTLIAASIDDALAWCILAVLSAIHLGSGSGGALRTIGLATLFAVVMLTVVAPLLRPLGRGLARTGRLGPGAMYVVILVPLTAGWLTDWIGVYAVFGGFIAGLTMPRDPAFRQVLHGRMMDVVSTLLLPVFFTFSGLNTHLNGIAGGAMLLAFAADPGGGLQREVLRLLAVDEGDGLQLARVVRGGRADERARADDPHLHQHRPGTGHDHAGAVRHAGARGRHHDRGGPAALQAGAARTSRAGQKNRLPNGHALWRNRQPPPEPTIS